ncbi:unnamed protein product, partial [Polarella glacialis]
MQDSSAKTPGGLPDSAATAVEQGESEATTSEAQPKEPPKEPPKEELKGQALIPEPEAAAQASPAEASPVAPPEEEEELMLVRASSQEAIAAALLRRRLERLESMEVKEDPTPKEM